MAEWLKKQSTASKRQEAFEKVALALRAKDLSPVIPGKT